MRIALGQSQQAVEGMGVENLGVVTGGLTLFGRGQRGFDFDRLRGLCKWVGCVE